MFHFSRLKLKKPSLILLAFSASFAFSTYTQNPADDECIELLSCRQELWER